VAGSIGRLRRGPAHERDGDRRGQPQNH
jgi:hypothetical protein